MNKEDLRIEIACAADLLNKWCRESGVQEVKNPYENLELRNTINRLWYKISKEMASKHPKEKV